MVFRKKYEKFRVNYQNSKTDYKEVSRLLLLKNQNKLKLLYEELELSGECEFLGIRIELPFKKTY